MHHDVIAVHDVLIDHRVAPYPQRVVGAAGGQHGIRDGEGLLVQHGLDRHTGRHHAEQRDVARAADALGRQHLDGATLVVRTTDVALPLQIGQMLVHRGQ